jgi:hypothetical protein
MRRYMNQRNSNEIPESNNHGGYRGEPTLTG